MLLDASLCRLVRASEVSYKLRARPTIIDLQVYQARANHELRDTPEVPDVQAELDVTCSFE